MAGRSSRYDWISHTELQIPSANEIHAPSVGAGRREKWSSDANYRPAKLLTVLLFSLARVRAPLAPYSRSHLVLQSGAGHADHRMMRTDSFFGNLLDGDLLKIANKELSAKEARDEAHIMGPTSEINVLKGADSVENAAKAINISGVTRLNNAVPLELVESVLAEVNQKLEVVQKAEDKNLLGQVLCRKNRYDVLLDPSDENLQATTQAVQVALAGRLGELFDLLGLQSDAPMHEFAALVSDPGAPRQPLHPDTGFQGLPPLFTVFLALQDIEVAMGPTLFLIGSQELKAHQLFNARGRTKELFIKATPSVVNVLKAGDIAIFDSRVLHAGDENISGLRRSILYFTIGNPRANLTRVPPGSISSRARGGHTLGSLKSTSK